MLSYSYKTKPKWRMRTKFLTEIQQLEMEDEVMNPNRSTTVIHWHPLKDYLSLQFVFPINETTLFEITHKTEEVTHFPYESNACKPRIYSRLYKKRSARRGKYSYTIYIYVYMTDLF